MRACSLDWFSLDWFNACPFSLLQHVTMILQLNHWLVCKSFQPQDVSSLAILPSQSQKQWKHIRFVASCTSWWLVDGHGHPASRNVWISTLEIKSIHTDLLPGHELHLWPWKHDSIEFEVWSSQTNQTPSSCGASIKNRSCCTHSCKSPVQKKQSSWMHSAISIQIRCDCMQCKSIWSQDTLESLKLQTHLKVWSCSLNHTWVIFDSRAQLMNQTVQNCRA